LHIGVILTDANVHFKSKLWHETHGNASLGLPYSTYERAPIYKSRYQREVPTDSFYGKSRELVDVKITIKTSFQ
jgi:hypothetical protein